MQTKENRMKKLALATLLAIAATGAFAGNDIPPGIAKKMAGCDSCGHVTDVHKEKRKGEGGAVGIVGGAVVGGLLGNQVGKGNGKTVATVAGAAAGGYAGNEVQKHITSREVWVTKVTMKDGTVRTFEQEAQPGWKSGSVVKVNGRTLSLYAGT